MLTSKFYCCFCELVNWWNKNSKLNPEFKAVKPDADPTESKQNSKTKWRDIWRLCIDGYAYSLTLNGGQDGDKTQSAVVTLECDSSQSRSVSIFYIDLYMFDIEAIH